MAVSSTSICNMALARIGQTRIVDYGDATDTNLAAIYCRLFYEQTAKALMRTHWWRFAKHRIELSQDTVDPTFQWTYAYHLPNDFLRAIMVYDGSDLPSGRTYVSYELEGNRLLIDESSVYLKYIRWVSSELSWDPLFTELFILVLAKKLCIPLSQDSKIKIDIDRDLGPLMKQVRALDRQEQEQIGRDELRTWNDARFSDTA